MQLVSYLNFNGTCEEAFKFYEKALGGTIVAMFPHAGTPAEEFVAPEWKNKIMHARLTVGDVKAHIRQGLGQAARAGGYAACPGVSIGAFKGQDMELSGYGHRGLLTNPGIHGTAECHSARGHDGIRERV